MSRIESVADRGTNRPACPAVHRDFIGRAVRWLRFVGLLEESCDVRHSHAEEVAAFREWMCKDRGWSGSTIRSYCNTVDCFFDWMDEWGILLGSVGIADIDQAVARWHTRGCSRLTIGGYLQRLRTCGFRRMPMVIPIHAERGFRRMSNTPGLTGRCWMT